METQEIGGKYGISLSHMIDRIVWAAENTISPDQEIDERKIRLMIIEFMLTHGEEAVIKLYGFIRYAQLSAKSEEEKTKMIASTISHDLNGRKDKLMLPRSDSYLEYAGK